METRRNRLTIQTSLACLILLFLLSACYTQAAVQNAPAHLSPAEIFSQVEFPGQNIAGKYIHLQWMFEELEGMPPRARAPQSVQTIHDVWVENDSPWHYHLSTRIEPGDVQVYDRGWDGKHLLTYSYSDDPSYAIYRVPKPGEHPSAPLEVSQFIQKDSSLFQQVQGAGNLLKEIGVDNIEPWGMVRTIAYEWDGATAAMIDYAGYPHTILFKIAEETHQLIEWSDVIHTDKGDVTHRRYKLLVWEELDALPQDVDPWAMTLPAGAVLVDALPAPDQTATQAYEPIRTIMGQEVKDFGWPPWLPTYLPAGATLASVNIFPQWKDGYYHVTYEIGGNPSIFVDQALDLTYGWGNDPEIMELPWATVELGQIDPISPDGWVALIRLHQQGDEQLPNINILVELADKDVLLRIIASLQPVNE
jgi:hypothetical protein